MLMPKRAKYRKVQRGRMTGTASRGNKVAYGEFGIQALEPGWITGNQIEAARIAMTRYTKRGGQVWIKIFPDKPLFLFCWLVYAECESFKQFISCPARKLRSSS